MKKIRGTGPVNKIKGTGVLKKMTLLGGFNKHMPV